MVTTTTTHGGRRVYWALFLVAASALTAGCDRGARSLALDPELARASLTTALDSWKQGERPAALRDRSPAIVASDTNWASGYKLEKYTVTGDEKNDGTNLHITVDLVVRDTKNRPRQSSVTYTVGTSPVITVSAEE